MAAGRITAVGTEVAVRRPSAFCAVTLTRSVLPSSTVFRTYVRSFAPLIKAQLPPSASQRRQAKSKSVGFPVHVPSRAVSVFPTSGVPPIVGGCVFVGGAGVAARPAVPVSMIATSPAVTDTSPSGINLLMCFLIWDSPLRWLDEP